MDVRVTRHAKQRLKERSGLNAKSYERMAEKALKDGIPHSKTKGNLNKWIDYVYSYNKTANNIRLYGDKAFLFKDNTLITVLQIPCNLTKNIKKMISQQLDN